MKWKPKITKKRKRNNKKIFSNYALGIMEHTKFKEFSNLKTKSYFSKFQMENRKKCSQEKI